MKKGIFASLLLVSLAVNAQEANEIKPAAKGVVYGANLTTETTAISVNELQSNLTNGVFEGKVTGKVKEVCLEMGCWMKIEKADGTTLMVRTKDHGFFMPKNIVGKTVSMEGTAKAVEMSEKDQKHYAEDAGKTKKEIAKIKGNKTELQFTASGVEVLD
jgi:hypothetical protein